MRNCVSPLGFRPAGRAAERRPYKKTHCTVRAGEDTGPYKGKVGRPVSGPHEGKTLDPWAGLEPAPTRGLRAAEDSRPYEGSK